MMIHSLFRLRSALVLLSVIFTIVVSLNQGEVAFCETKTYIGWAVGSNVDGYGAILHSNDGGNTWARQGSASTIPDVSLSAVAAIDTNICWVVGSSFGGYGTILRTTDGGQTWTRQGSLTMIPDADLLKIYALNKDTAWVAGQSINSGVIHHTTDGGANWQKQYVSGTRLVGISFVTLNEQIPSEELPYTGR